MTPWSIAPYWKAQSNQQLLGWKANTYIPTKVAKIERYCTYLANEKAETEKWKSEVKYVEKEKKELERELAEVKEKFKFEKVVDVKAEPITDTLYVKEIFYLNLISSQETELKQLAASWGEKYKIEKESVTNLQRQLTENENLVMELKKRLAESEKIVVKLRTELAATQSVKVENENMKTKILELTEKLQFLKHENELKVKKFEELKEDSFEFNDKIKQLEEKLCQTEERVKKARSLQSQMKEKFSLFEEEVQTVKSVPIQDKEKVSQKDEKVQNENSVPFMFVNEPKPFMTLNPGEGLGYGNPNYKKGYRSVTPLIYDTKTLNHCSVGNDGLQKLFMKGPVMNEREEEIREDQPDGVRIPYDYSDLNDNYGKKTFYNEDEFQIPYTAEELKTSFEVNQQVIFPEVYIPNIVLKKTITKLDHQLEVNKKIVKRENQQLSESLKSLIIASAMMEKKVRELKHRNAGLLKVLKNERKGKKVIQVPVKVHTGESSNIKKVSQKNSVPAKVQKSRLSPIGTTVNSQSTQSKNVKVEKKIVKVEKKEVKSEGKENDQKEIKFGRSAPKGFPKLYTRDELFEFAPAHFVDSAIRHNSFVKNKDQKSKSPTHKKKTGSKHDDQKKKPSNSDATAQRKSSTKKNKASEKGYVISIDAYDHLFKQPKVESNKTNSSSKSPNNLGNSNKLRQRGNQSTLKVESPKTPLNPIKLVHSDNTGQHHVKQRNEKRKEPNRQNTFTPKKLFTENSSGKSQTRPHTSKSFHKGISNSYNVIQKPNGFHKSWNAFSLHAIDTTYRYFLNTANKDGPKTKWVPKSV